MLPEGWSEDDDAEATPPVFFLREDGRLFFRPNGVARFGIRGEAPQMRRELIPVAAGQTLQVYAGTAGRSLTRDFTVSAFVEATLQVRNVFGNVASTSQEVELTPESRPAQALLLRRGR
jgi:hypothetical protein